MDTLLSSAIKSCQAKHDINRDKENKRSFRLDHIEHKVKSKVTKMSAKLKKRSKLNCKTLKIPSGSLSSWTDCMDSDSSDMSLKEDVGLKCLSTVLNLDKEHNMFGLSSYGDVILKKPQKRFKPTIEKPAFPQTTIIHTCCAANRCCRNLSKTDLPTSLKCNGCRVFNGPCSTLASCPSRPCYAPRAPCCRPKKSSSCKIKSICLSSPCYGMSVTENPKQKYVPPLVEITPRAPCVLNLPYMARPCTHCPPCMPPNQCCPYLMPCFWPSRPGAPCSTPGKCFHNPRCPPPRERLPPASACGRRKPLHSACPPKCEDQKDGNKGKASCPVRTCAGNNPELADCIKKIYATGKK